MTFNKVDSQIEKGMSATDVAYTAIRAMFLRTTQLWICPAYYYFLIPAMQLSTTFQTWYLQRRLKEQLTTI